MLLPLGHATTPTCTGTTSNAFVPTGPPTNVVTKQVNGFIIITENFGLCFTGAFNGDTQGTVTIIVNTSTGNGVFFGQNTFTGIVTTSSGSASGTIFVPFVATFSAGSFEGPYTLYGGTGGLAKRGRERGPLASGRTGSRVGRGTSPRRPGAGARPGAGSGTA